MKASTHQTKLPGFRHPGVIKWLGLMLAGAILSSCGTGSSGTLSSRPVALQSSHWFKAKNQPPTYFPKGVPVDHPTTFKDGMWVTTGDAAGTRYFIPVRGVNTKALIAEAQSAMTPEKRKQVAKGGGVEGLNSKDAAGALGAGLAGFVYLLLAVDHAAGHPGYDQKGGGLWNSGRR